MTVRQAIEGVLCTLSFLALFAALWVVTPA